MNNNVTYTGTLVELRREIIGNEFTYGFNKGEIDKIDSIQQGIYYDIEKDDNIGIRVCFASGKVLVQENVTNYHSWLKRTFKLTI